jgi:hypothetical protein
MSEVFGDEVALQLEVPEGMEDAVPGGGEVIVAAGEPAEGEQDVAADASKP